MVMPIDVRPQSRGAVSRIELASGFLKIGLVGFGGVAPWARRVIVEERRWMSEADYAAILGVGQILPGANTVNAAVIIGERFQGPLGSLIAVAALMACPLAILIAAAMVYARVAGMPDVAAALDGLAMAAAGLVIGTALKMARALRPDLRSVVIGSFAVVAVAGFGVSLVWTVAVLAPVSVLLTLSGRRP